MNKFLEDLMHFSTVQEMEATFGLVDEFDAEGPAKLAELMADKTIYLTGIGSSLCMPGNYSRYLGSFISPNTRIELYQPELATIPLKADKFPDNSFFTILSNSGSTMEAVERLIPQLDKHTLPYYTITAVPDSTIAKASGANVGKIGKKIEIGIAATQSVMLQTMFLDSALHKLAGEPDLLSDKDARMELSAQMRGNFESELSDKVNEILDAAFPKFPKIIAKAYYGLKNLLGMSKTIYWLGYTGVEQELALKTGELTEGKAKSKTYAGTFFVHGPQTQLNRGDIVVITGCQNYSEKDYATIYEDAAKRGAKVITMENNEYASALSLPSLGCKTTRGYEVYSELTRGWRFLLEINKRIGADLDHPGINKFRAK